MAKLTAKQSRFVEEYLIDLNATQAAIRAGYSEKTAKQIGSRLLTNVDVQAAVSEGQEARAERTEITQDYVLTTIHSTIERCRQAEPVFYKNGDPVMCETEDGEVVPAYTFQANAALKGCELLGKHLGMFTEKVEHTGKGGGPIETRDVGALETARRVAFILAQGSETLKDQADG